jgi:AbrB family looped-hinge helix DNA binding protein
MSIQATIDKAGRIVLPKALRDELQLEPGETLELERTGDHITLRPRRGAGTMHKKKGFWVLRSANTIPSSVTDRVLDDLRSARDLSNAGRKK